MCIPGTNHVFMCYCSNFDLVSRAIRIFLRGRVWKRGRGKKDTTVARFSWSSSLGGAHGDRVKFTSHDHGDWRQRNSASFVPMPRTNRVGDRSTQRKANT